MKRERGREKRLGREEGSGKRSERERECVCVCMCVRMFVDTMKMNKADPDVP